MSDVYKDIEAYAMQEVESQLQGYTDAQVQEDQQAIDAEAEAMKNRVSDYIGGAFNE